MSNQSSPDIKVLLPAWCRLNDVDFNGVAAQNVEGRGVGLVAVEELKAERDASDAPALIKLPRELVLSRSTVEEHAKVDGHFRQLFDAVGRKSMRADICLFLLTQRVLAASPTARGVPTPFLEYIKFLPSEVPVPTMWSTEERELLRGTSLELAVQAKLAALNDEFEHFRDKSSELPFWNSLIWDNGRVSMKDWILVDAWYRSRSLELPHSGEAMVPVVDLANHSSERNAYYEERGKTDHVELILRPTFRIPAGGEITISYGEGKSGAEMLFSYGFMDPTRSTDTMTLPLAPMDDDPLGKAKLHVFDGPVTVELERTNGLATWRSPFAWLSCLNEEDGLAFRVLQDNEGQRELRVFWQEEDVTGRVGELEDLVSTHALYKLFRLRVVMVIADRVASQLESLRGSLAEQATLGSTSSVRTGRVESVEALKTQEASVLETAVAALETEKSNLLGDETVVAYLGSMEISQSEQADDARSNEDDDFS